MSRILKPFFCISFLCAFFMFWGAESLSAQYLAPGASLGYSTEAQNPGVQARVYYFVNEQLAFGTEFGSYLPKVSETTSGKDRSGLWELNLNAHYLVDFGGKFAVYPLGGLNLTRNWSREASGTNSAETRVGLNAGAGLHAFLGPWVPYLEYDFLWGVRRNHGLQVGVLYTLGGTLR